MTPTDAKGMARGIGVHLKALRGLKGRTGLENASPERHDLVVRGLWIHRVQIEVDLLLLRAVRPLGRDVRGIALDTNPPLALGVNHAVPVIVTHHAAAYDGGPKTTFGLEVGGVKDDNAANEFHDGGLGAERTNNFVREQSGLAQEG